ncbi:MAG: pentapeptide repeat-containing protein [Candidatus Methanofastidiosia archaeon]
MKSCCYTWKQWDDKNNEYVEKSCPEEVWHQSRKYCIFHDPSKQKNAELFKQGISDKIAKGDFNFWGYRFHVNIEFVKQEFHDSVYFDKSAFYGIANFDEAEFQTVSFNDARFKYASFSKTFFGDASFDRAIFQDSSFNSAVFGKAHFDGTVFKHNADFIGTEFEGEVHFDNAVFQDVSLIDATFKKTASFHSATFKKTVYFRRANFEQDALFDKATFYNAFFGEAIFHKVSFDGVFVERDLRFSPSKVEELNLQYSQFKFKGHITTNLSKTKLLGADLENIVFTELEPEKESIYEEKHMKQLNLTFENIETIYRNLKHNMQDKGDYSRAGRFFFREMEMKRKGARNKKRYLSWIWFEIYRFLAGYGESPQNTIAISIFSIFSCALLYLGTGCLKYTLVNPCFSQKAIDALYFSFVTFTTLGLGDIRPLTCLGKALVCFEAMLGVFLIALFVVTFVRKMAR